ncbi:unannotated protein [freshwater metagenome]|uniref:Unannotated protein n=1 Tax=freshwater metagenome TaxID=449393 RepID=A0A6J5ZML6_9ZZZZ
MLKGFTAIGGFLTIERPMGADCKSVAKATVVRTHYLPPENARFLWGLAFSNPLEISLDFLVAQIMQIESYRSTLLIHQLIQVATFGRIGANFCFVLK